MPYEETIQGDPLHLVDFARSSQMKRRRSGVHQSVPNPILVLLLGDSLADQLEQIHTQLTSRWSSQLGALQFCYFYTDKPYQGGCSILQAKVAAPQGAAGAGALCRDTGSLQAVNRVLRDAGEHISKMPMISMSKAEIHIILPVCDPMGAFVTDIAAVAQGWMSTFGAASNDCYLYLLLSQLYNTVAEKEQACAVLDQVRDGEGGNLYTQPVLLEQQDGQPTDVRSERIFRKVILLDDVDEKYRRYNQHGERLQLLCDLIETNWSIEGYVITAGVQEATAGPEYWLAQAADTVCGRVLQELSSTEADTELSAKPLYEAIEKAMPNTMPDWQVMHTCCLFLRGRVGRITPDMPVNTMEEGVFGTALSDAFQSWRDAVQPAEIPQAVQQALDQSDVDVRLEELADNLRAWAEEQEEKAKRPPDSVRGFKPKKELSEEDNVRQLQNYLLKYKYGQLRDRAGNTRCAQIARKCAEGCFDRIQELKKEGEMFEEFAEMVRETWYTLRDAFNNGNPMEVSWTEPLPSLRQLRRAGARAIRDGDPREALSMIADCVDLGGGAEQSSVPTDPTLYCRLTILVDANTKTYPIKTGISAGRIVKLTTIAQRYNEDDICRVFAVMKARRA